MSDHKRHLFEVKGLAPGETIGMTGVYRVVHAEHRADHEVVAIAGDVLPGCRVCLGEVRFYLERPIDYATHDWDLSGPLSLPRASSE